jgi:hypothetical protein
MRPHGLAARLGLGVFAALAVLAVFAVFVALSSLAAAPAWALCPNCLGQSSSLSSTLRFVGLFLLVPPAVFLAVALVVRRLVRQSAPPAPASGSGGDQAG